MKKIYELAIKDNFKTIYKSGKRDTSIFFINITRLFENASKHGYSLCYDTLRSDSLR